MTGHTKAEELLRASSDDAAWVGDLDDDCTLSRYGMTAHVEKMDRNCWWFNVTTPKRDGSPGYNDLFNTADNATHVPLRSGKVARRAAECALELLRNTDGADK